MSVTEVGINESPANKKRGYLLRMPDDSFVFRIYTSADRKEWKDYKIRHSDLEIEIVDNYSSLFDINNNEGYIDYPSRLGKAEKQNNVAR